MRIPRSLRDLQVERESLFLDFSSQRLFHGLDLFFGQRRQEFSFCAVISDAMSCDHERQGSRNAAGIGIDAWGVDYCLLDDRELDKLS